MFTLLLASLSQADWGYVTVGECSPIGIASDASGDRIFLSLKSGGIWLTENGGYTWIPINERICNSEVVFPLNYTPQVFGPSADTLVVDIYTISPDYNGTEFHSYDGGSTWSRFDLDPYWPDSLDNVRNDHITFPLTPADRVYNARDSGFAYSNYPGIWQVVDIDPITRGVEGMYIDPDNSNTLYVFGSWGPDQGNTGPDVGGIIASYDAGLTWLRITDMEELTEDTGFIIAMERLNNNTLIALCS